MADWQVRKSYRLVFLPALQFQNGFEQKDPANPHSLLDFSGSWRFLCCVTLGLRPSLLAEHGLTANPPSFSLPCCRRAFYAQIVRCRKNASAKENQNRPIPDSCQGRLNDGLEK